MKSIKKTTALFASCIMAASSVLLCPSEELDRAGARGMMMSAIQAEMADRSFTVENGEQITIDDLISHGLNVKAISGTLPDMYEDAYLYSGYIFPESGYSSMDVTGKTVIVSPDVLKNGKKSKYFDWFIIHGDTVDQKEVNYECFSICNYMPKWNTSNPEVQDFLISIAVHWIRQYHIDGWRLDVSDEVSHHFWRRFRQAVKAANPDCAIIGENWHNANAYLQGDQYDSIMNYAFTKACLDFFAFDALDSQGFAEKLSELLMRNTDTVNNMMMNLLDSHDTHRFFTQVGENKTKLESALAVLYLFVGAPCIYYGTEIAMPGGYDPDCRRTMDWEQAEAEGSTWKLIQKLTKLKKEEPALHVPDIKLYARNNVFCMERRDLLLQIDGTTFTHTIERLG